MLPVRTLYIPSVHDKNKKENVLRYIESGVQQGAKLRLDDRENLKITGDYPQACFLGPTGK